MSPRVTRLLHVLVLAPVTALSAAALAPSLHAHAAAAAPTPYVVCIDPGHGGASDNTDPSLQYDPGAIGVNGVQEKDATLDIGMRLRERLAQDEVTVAMTRTDDRFVTIDAREQTCETADARLFISVHLNYFKDPAIGGSLVLYPTAASLPLAKAMAATLGKELATDGIANGGVQLRDNWWTHATMPTVTVEGAYLTNPREAAWLATAAGREKMANSIADGIEAFDPSIATHKKAVLAWNAAHPAAATTQSSAAGATAVVPAERGTPWLRIIIVAAVAVALWRSPRLRQHVLALLAWALLLFLRQTTAGWQRAMMHRHRRRRRRRAQQRRAAPQRSSVYDELWF